MSGLYTSEAPYRGVAWVLLFGIMLFVCAPILFVVVTSFNERGIYLIRSGYRLSLHWYESLPKAFFSSFKVSLVVATASAAIALVPGIMAAFVIVRGRFPGKALLTNLFLSPLILPLIVLGVSYYRYFLVVFDLTGVSLLDSYWGFILAHAGFTWAYVVRAVVAGLQNFDLHLEEAAADLGAGRLYTTLRVTLPTIRPSIVAGMIFAFMISFDDVPVSLFLYGTTTTPLPIELMNYMSDNIDPYITAMSSLTVFFSVALMLVVERAVGLRRVVGLPEISR
jgi:putative spermidine/putrescine transport system permease protein